MARVRKAPFKKRVLAKYIKWLEILGFIMVAALLAGMVGSTIYKIDDVSKFTNAPVSPLREPVMLPSESYVVSVAVQEGARVEAGQELMRVVTGEAELPLLKAARSMQEGLDVLRSRTESTPVPPGLEEGLVDAIERSRQVIQNEAPAPIAAPVAGIISTESDVPFDGLEGRVVAGQVGIVYTYDTLRIVAGIGDENAMRVRINKLAEEDVLDWKILTGHLKGDAPEDPRLRPFWEEVQTRRDLDEVKAAKRPLKRNMPLLLDVINGVLMRPDYYKPEEWTGKQMPIRRVERGRIPAEAQELIERGVEDLETDDVVRLNRLLLTAAMPGAIAPSANERQVVKTKLYIPKQHKDESGKIVVDEPEIYQVAGHVAQEPAGGQVVVDIPNPPREIVEYMAQTREDPDLPKVFANGNIVVGQISLFGFLFK